MAPLHSRSPPPGIIVASDPESSSPVSIVDGVNRSSSSAAFLEALVDDLDFALGAGLEPSDKPVGAAEAAAEVTVAMLAPRILQS